MRLDEIRTLIEAATPGEWYTDFSEAAVRQAGTLEVISQFDHHKFSNTLEREGDARFIAAARTLLPALLDVVELAREFVEEEHWSRKEPLYPRIRKALAVLEGLKLP